MTQLTFSQQAYRVLESRFKFSGPAPANASTKKQALLASLIPSVPVPSTQQIFSTVMAERNTFIRLNTVEEIQWAFEILAETIANPETSSTNQNIPAFVSLKAFALILHNLENLSPPASASQINEITGKLYYATKISPLPSLFLSYNSLSNGLNIPVLDNNLRSFAPRLFKSLNELFHLRFLTENLSDPTACYQLLHDLYSIDLTSALDQKSLAVYQSAQKLPLFLALEQLRIIAEEPKSPPDPTNRTDFPYLEQKLNTFRSWMGLARTATTAYEILGLCIKEIFSTFDTNNPNDFLICQPLIFRACHQMLFTEDFSVDTSIKQILTGLSAEQGTQALKAMFLDENNRYILAVIPLLKFLKDKQPEINSIERAKQIQAIQGAFPGLISIEKGIVPFLYEKDIDSQVRRILPPREQSTALPEIPEESHQYSGYLNYLAEQEQRQLDQLHTEFKNANLLEFDLYGFFARMARVSFYLPEKHPWTETIIKKYIEAQKRIPTAEGLQKITQTIELIWGDQAAPDEILKSQMDFAQLVQENTQRSAVLNKNPAQTGQTEILTRGDIIVEESTASPPLLLPPAIQALKDDSPVKSFKNTLEYLDRVENQTPDKILPILNNLKAELDQLCNTPEIGLPNNKSYQSNMILYVATVLAKIHYICKSDEVNFPIEILRSMRQILIKIKELELLPKIITICATIKKAQYNIPFTSPDNTLARLKNILEISTFYIVWRQKHPQAKIRGETINLVRSTEPYRTRDFSTLSPQEQRTIRTLNLELLFAAYSAIFPRDLFHLLGEE